MRCAATLLTIGALFAANPARANVDGELAALTAELPHCEASRAHCIGLYIHVPTRDASQAAGEASAKVDGASAAAAQLIASPAFLASELAAVNRHFAPLGVGFQIAGVDTLPPDTAHIATREDRDAVAVGRLTGTVIHVFLTSQLDDIDVPDGVIRGVTWHHPDSDRKYVILSTVAPESVLAHELGHVFGLPHSRYAISIMNKRKRTTPPPEQRRFADDEITRMRPVLKQLLRDHVIADIAR